jgi:peptidoglycan/xylan/chitin deacetylase (PgdA/CDA1 family)
LNAQLETWLDAILARSPAQPLAHWRAARHLTVLVYHSIEDANRFEEQIDYLLRAKHPVSLDNVVDAAAGRGGLPSRAVLITFDDGDRSLMDAALPVLKDRGLGAVTFVIAGLLDSDEPYWWHKAETLAEMGGKSSGFDDLPPAKIPWALKEVPDDERLALLAELSQTAKGSPPPKPQLLSEELPMLESAGLTIGNHTLTHPILPRCDDDKVEAEIHQAHDILTAALGHAPRAFAYPNGDTDPRVVRTLRALGYEAAFLFDHRLSQVPPPDPLNISRLRVDSTTSLDRFRIVVSGLHSALHHALGRS